MKFTILLSAAVRLGRPQSSKEARRSPSAAVPLTPSKNFGYRISVTPGEISNNEEITTTYHSHKAVVYPTRHWKAERAGAHTVCVVGAHGASPHPVAHDCRTFTVR